MIETVTAPLLSIRNVAKSFGKTPVLRDISLEIAEGEFLTILGRERLGQDDSPSIIAGFESADSGEILWRTSGIDSLPPYRRRVNTVFQNYALFPHLTSNKMLPTACGSQKCRARKSRREQNKPWLK